MAPVAPDHEAILDGMKRAPGALASIGLLFIHGVGLIAATFEIVVIARDTRSASWPWSRPGGCCALGWSRWAPGVTR
jgi:hypothetical protein